MPTESEIKGSITIFAGAVEQTPTVLPELGRLDRHVQTMQWTLVAGATTKFGPTGIVFRKDVPGHNDWPGETPIRINDWQYRAAVNKRVSETETYYYDYFIDFNDGAGEKMVSKVFDPDIENQPQP